MKLEPAPLAIGRPSREVRGRRRPDLVPPPSQAPATGPLMRQVSGESALRQAIEATLGDLPRPSFRTSNLTGIKPTR